MSCNIANEYIAFSKNSIGKYLQLILNHYFDQDIYDDLINAYINTRYYNIYPRKEERFEANIVYYLKKSLQEANDDEKFRQKATYMFQMFKYIFSFDGVVECDSVRKLISEINEFRTNKLNIVDDTFEAKLYNMLENDLLAKKDFLDSFSDKNFSVNYIKVKDHVFDCVLEHKLKFSKLYSEYAITKVFNSKNISEQKSFVTYPIVAVKILQDIIKGNFTKVYLVDYVFSISTKEKKNQRLLKYIDNDITKEKIILKLNYTDYQQDKEKVYELTRNGFKIALNIDKDFEFNEENIKLLKLFTYVITSDDKFYNEIKDKCDALFIPSS